MNMQNVKDLAITEGDVRTIHDSNGNLLWGRLAYDTKYAGDTFQQTYTGKNLIAPTDLHNGAVITYLDLQNDIYSETDNTKYRTIKIDNLPAGTYTISISWTQTARLLRIAFDGAMTAINQDGNKYTFTSSTTGLFGFVFRNTTSSNFSDDDYTIQLETGSTATAYEPYVGGIPAPNPDYPQDVQVVTGEQTVTITDGGEESQEYTVNLGSIELCKIGGYQDYIYKSGDDWYVHKESGKVILNGTETDLAMYTTNKFRVSISDIALQTSGVSEPPITTSDYFVGSNYAAVSAGSADNSMSGYYNAHQIRIYSTKWSTLDSFETWLSTHNTTVYYALATPTDTKITDSTLISQLNAIHEWLTRYGYNSSVSGNLPLLIEQTNLS